MLVLLPLFLDLVASLSFFFFFFLFFFLFFFFFFLYVWPPLARFRLFRIVYGPYSDS